MLDISDCKNISDVARKYYGTATGGNRRKAKRLFIENGVDPEKWSNQNKKEMGEKEIARRVENPPEIAEKIYKLRDKGYCYKDIAKELNCSKGTVAYWCGEGQKEKTKNRKKKMEPWFLLMIRKCEFFRNGRESHQYIRKVCKDWKLKLRNAVSFFCKRGSMKNWGSRKVLEKYGYVTTCYLTGRTIDFRKDDWSPDHIISVARGGDGSFENFAPTVPIANSIKGDLLPEELFDLCEEILRYNRPELFK